MILTIAQLKIQKMFKKKNICPNLIQILTIYWWPYIVIVYKKIRRM